MALLLNDRVKETTTTTGTGTVNLAGAIDGFETFVAGIGNGNTVYYAIVHQDNAEFEVGLGTVTDASPDTLSRSTIFSSSNSDGLVSFSSGTKDVFCTLPASKAIVKNDVNKVGINTNTPAQELHVVGNAFVSGQTFLGDASGDTVTLTGSLAHASHFTIDAGGDIHLDTGGQIKLDLNGTLFGNLFPSSGNLGIHVAQQDKDLIISGNDGGSGINALVIDMSDAGTATFNHDIKLGDNGRATFGDSQDLQIYHDATHSYIANFTNTLYLRTASTLQIEKSDGSEDLATFAVDGAVVLYHDGSSRFATDAEGANVTGVLDVSSKVAVAGGTEATSTDGSIRTEGGLSVAKKIFGGSDLTIDNGSISLTYDVSAGQLNHAGATFHINKTNGVDVAIGNDDFYVDMSTNRIGIGNVSPDVSLDIGSRTDSIHVPVGTTAQRPGSPAAGYFRYNSTNGKFEGYSDQWNTIGSGTNMDTNIFTGDGSNTNFTLSTAPDTENNLIVFIDGVFQAQNVYSISGTTLTFATAPANGRVITAYHSTTTVGGSNNSIATMTGDGSDTTLTLTTAPVNENNVFVYFDGVYQSKSNYSISGTTLTFSTAPPSGVAVEAITATNTSITTATKLLDADGDTTIQVEESSDEDTIRFDIAGAEDFTMSANSFNVLSGSSASFADNSKALFGGGSDLQIYHSGSHSYIENYVGNLVLLNNSDDKDIIFQSDDGSGGIETYFYVDGSGKRVIFEQNTRVTDNFYAAFGSDADLRIFHDGANSYIRQSSGATGNLIIEQDLTDADILFKGDDGGSTITALQLDMSAGGSASFSHDIYLLDNSRVYLGSNSDMEIFHEGSYAMINNTTGHLYVRNNADDSDIIFQTDDGSGGIVSYVTLDGSAALTQFDKDTKHVDSVKATFGNSADLQIYHDGSNSFIQDAGTGGLYMPTSAIYMRNAANSAGVAYFVDGGAVTLYHNGISKFATTSTGVSISDNITLGSDSVASSINILGDVFTLDVDSNGNTGGAPNMRFAISGSEKVRIDSSGNLGIGTTSPAEKLEVNGNIKFGDGHTIGNGAGDNLHITSGTSENIIIDSLGGVTVISSNGTEKARFDASGNLFVGGTTLGAAGSLSIEDDGHFRGVLASGTAGDSLVGAISGVSNGFQVNTDASNNQVYKFHNGGTASMTIDSSGNIIIGKASNTVAGAGTLLYPSGSAFFTLNNTGAANTLHVYDDVDSAYRFYVRATGSIAGTIFATSTSISSASDERLKENIKDLETGLTEIMALKPRRFDWKEGEGNNTKNNAGFIAQEVETVLPELVGDYLHDKLDDVKSIKMGDILPTLVKAVQEQQTLIEDLKTRIEVLEG